MIKFVLLLSRQGKVRLSKWYTTMTQKDRAKIIREITPMVLARPLKLCNFLDWKDNKLVYKRYASLYFVAGIEEGDNELITLEVIHHFVEVLDRYFGNVCELDLIFNFHKAYFMLDEMMLAGELQEPSKKAVTRVIEAQDQLGVMPATATMTTLRAPPAAASPAPGTTWTVIFRLHGTVTKPPLSVTVVDEQTGETSDELPISSFGSAPWPRPGNKPGTLCSGTLTIPDSITPGALMVSYSGPAPEAKKPDSNRIWVSDVKLIPGSGPDVVISGHAWVNTLNSPRRFFNGTPCLPSQTPPGLTALRQEELNVIKGVGDAKAHAMRQFSDRVIEYDLYNDLGHLPLDAKKDTFSVRPILGGGAAVEGYKYPRRLRTGRPQTSTKRETNPTSGLMWVPQDEDFDETKSADFNGDALTDLTLPLVAYQLKTAVGDLHSVNKKMGLLAGIIAIYRFLKNIVLSLQGKAQILDDQKGFQGGVWNSFDDVIAIYRKKDDPTAGNANIAAQAKVGASDDDMRAMMRDLKPETRERVLRSGGIPLADWQSKEKRIGSDFWDFLRQKINDALQWEVPLVWAGAHTPALPSDGPNPKPRPTAWQTDEEYGRQWVAGQNPVAITAPSSLPAGCTITGKLVDGMLEGSTMAHLLSKAKEAPQLFFVDYMEPYRSYAEKIDAIGGRKQHAGRLLLYKRKDGHIVPAAIELWHAVDGSADGKTAVYTRENCDPKVWLVAKAIFASLDSGIHQLVSHLLRTHVCQEPYILATDRCLSTMHPVYKLITPHFLYTLRMNANARSTLINQDPLTGILEATFTPGKYNMELSAKAYESWKFNNEGLPHDLVARGVAKAEKDGKVKLLVDDYPYAEDGLLIWTALKKWNDGYLNHYYKSNGDVAADAELQAWWTEIRTKGHPDADPAGWPEACKDGIKTVADLSDITTTMIWMGSAHHAAVNFSQYDFSGLTLNRSPLIRAAIPDEGTPEYAALTSSDEAVFEKAFLTYIADPFPATRITALMTVLSQHAPNEHFLSDDDQGLVTDDAALKLHKVFVDDMKAAEATIAQRNAGNSLARSLASAGLPYNYLVPSSPELPAGYPNITGRGIPYSISI